MRQPQAPLDAYYSWNYCVNSGGIDYRGAWRLYAAEELSDSPSVRDGVSLQEEKRQKWLMVTLVHSVGEELMQPMVVQGTAAILFHRFFAQHSLLKSDRLVAATACLFLAGKVEDAPRSLQRISENMHKSYCDQFQQISHEDAEVRWKNTAYQENFKAAVLAAERAVLFSLGFDFMIRLPYNCLLDFVGGYFKEPVEQACINANIQPGNVHQAAWDVCNESLRSSVVLTHTPVEIAVAAMYFSLKIHNLMQQMPGGLQWYAQWNVAEDRIQGVLQPLMAMYEEVAPQSMQSSTAQAASAPKPVAPIAHAALPAVALSQTSQQATHEQQQALAKARALASGHLPKQGSLPAASQQPDMLPGLQPRAQHRAVAPANMFMPASAGKVVRGVDPKPNASRLAPVQAAPHASSESLPASHSLGQSTSAAPRPTAASAGLQQQTIGGTQYQGQTHMNELIEADLQM